MFKSILVATDLSEASDHVVDCISGLRSLGAEKAILVYCLGLRYIEDMKNLLIPMIEPRLKAQKSVLEKAGFQVTAEITAGLPQFDVNRVAAEKDCSLIAVGSRGHTASDEILLGSVASELIHHATKPLLLVRVKMRKSEGGKLHCEAAFCRDIGRHVLYPTDFSDNAEHAFTCVEKLVKNGVKKITLMHVQDRTKIGKHLEHRLEEFNQIDNDRLERLHARLNSAGTAQVSIHVTYGSPVTDILEKARGDGISLIVMGSQGKGFIKEIFLGSVSHNVARCSEVSVLLIPALR